MPPHEPVETPPTIDDADSNRVPIHFDPGTGRRLTFVVVLFAAALLVTFVIVHEYRKSRAEDLLSHTLATADAAAPVDVARVDFASSIRALTLPGEAAPWFASTIYARVSGYVHIWKSDIGDHVKKGDVLATIDTPELDQQLIAARAKVAADKSEVEVAKTDANFASATNNRFKDSPKGVVSDEERDEKQAALDSATAKLAAANAQVDLDQADVNRLLALSEFKNVIAPYDGVITRRQIDIGDLVTAGSTASTTALYDIAQFDKVRVFVDVPQVSSAEIIDGMNATATSREFAGRSFIGTVTRTSHSIDAAAKTLKVEVDIANADLKLLPGTYLEVNFKIDDPRPPLEIPASALNFRSGGPEVAVVDKQGTVQFRKVTIARDMGNVVEIREGLSAGDMVALNISNQISDGDHVSVNVPKNASPADAAAPTSSEPHASINVSVSK